MQSVLKEGNESLGLFWVKTLAVGGCWKKGHHVKELGCIIFSS